MFTNRLFAFIITLTICFSANAQWSIKGNTTEKNASWNHLQMFSEDEWNNSNFATPEDMQWFNDARYGMFIHFGLSTYIEKDLSWGMCYTRKAPDRGQGPIADSVWTKYPQYFQFKEFDAREWVELAQKAGMKYIVTIAKHHDGFHMWDTHFSEFKVTNTPFGRDYLKEIADACHEAGMKFGIYYSQRDWYHPDYAPVDTALIVRDPEAPYFKPKPGITEVKPGASHQKYIDYQFNVVRELCTNYGKVDVFWFDACWWGGMFTSEMWDSENLTRMIRELQPGIIINNRASIPGDFDTPEQKIGMYQSRPWESCVTLTHSWSYSPTPAKSKKTIIDMLTATACGNGNMLLSWGPEWNGAFESTQRERLEEVGSWLRKYGHSIYETRGGPWYPEDWGGTSHRGNKVLVHITGDVDERLELSFIQNKILEAKLLTGGKVSYIQSDKGIVLDLSEAERDEESIIVELTASHDIKGMVDEKSSRSIFADPVYGGVISENATLKPGSISELDNPEHHQLLFGKNIFNSPYAFHTKSEEEPFVIIDLCRVFSVSGVGMNNQKRYKGNPGTFEVLVSENGADWILAEQHDNAFNEWEARVAQFNAGIQLPGINARFVKIALKANGKQALHLKRVEVYGKEL